MVLAEPLVSVALQFGPSEYFALMLLSLSAVTTIGGGNPLKAAFSTGLGLAIGTVGIDYTTGTLRFTYGMPSLFDGIDVIIAAIGLFAISEVIFGLANLHKQGATKLSETGSLMMTREDVGRSIGPWLRGSVLGFLIGILPGAGATISSFMSYGLERRITKRPQEFGNGAIEGVAGPESANNAAAGGALVPLLTLGIPGSAVAAVMLAALQGYGINTGPLLLQNQPELVWALIASLYIGNLMLLVLNLPLVGMWVKLLKIPEALLYPLILAFSTLGVYSLNRNPFDLLIMFAIGIVGFLLRLFRFPLAPLILGLVLGPMLETELRRALIGSRGDWMVLVDRPIASVILMLAFAVTVIPVLSALRRRASETAPAK
jgi:putative tricarboxylic transport membrane protein